MILFPCPKLIVRVSYLYAIFGNFMKIELLDNIVKRFWSEMRFLGMTKLPLLPIRKLPEVSWNRRVS